MEIKKLTRSIVYKGYDTIDVRQIFEVYKHKENRGCYAYRGYTIEITDIDERWLFEVKPMNIVEPKTDPKLRMCYTLAEALETIDDYWMATGEVYKYL